MNVWAGDFIEDIKGEVGDTMGMDPSDVRLIFKGKALHDDTLQLCDIGIKENSLLKLVGQSSSWQPIVSTLIPYGSVQIDQGSGIVRSTITMICLSKLKDSQSQRSTAIGVPGVNPSSGSFSGSSSIFVLSLLIDNDAVFVRCPWEVDGIGHNVPSVLPSVQDCMENPQCWFFQPAASLTRLAMVCKSLNVRCDMVVGPLAKHVIVTRSVINLYNDYLWEKAVCKSRGNTLPLSHSLVLGRARRSWGGCRPLDPLDMESDELIPKDLESMCLFDDLDKCD